MNTRRILTAAATLLAALALCACGVQPVHVSAVASRADPISLELSGPPSAQTAGILAARTDGSFSRSGLVVSVRTAATTSDALDDVEAGRVDVAMTSEPQLMLARQAGAYVLAFGAIDQSPSDEIVTLRARRIRSLRELRGRRIGTDGLASSAALLHLALAQANVPSGSVTITDVGADPAAALTSGRVAAVFTPASDTALALRTEHRSVRTLSLSALDAPTYDPLVFICSEDYFANHVNMLRRFVQAVGRGYVAIRADPATGVSALRAAEPSLGAATANASVSAALPSLFPSAGKPWGWQSTHDWNTFGRWLVAHHVIHDAEGWYLASTNQLLAGQGP